MLAGEANGNYRAKLKDDALGGALGATQNKLASYCGNATSEEMQRKT